MRRPTRSVLLGLALAGLTLAGCAHDEMSGPRPPPVWLAPVERLEPLDEAAVNIIVTKEGIEAGIVELDRHPLAFQITEAALRRLQSAGLPEDVLDYLRKRRLIDWDREHGYPSGS